MKHSGSGAYECPNVVRKTGSLAGVARTDGLHWAFSQLASQTTLVGNSQKVTNLTTYQRKKYATKTFLWKTLFEVDDDGESPLV